VERNAASIQDNDGRYPLHLVVINNLDQPILDRMIRANPQSLGTPDHLDHTPIHYAILKADRCRLKSIDVMWNSPRTKEQAARQNNQREVYENVLFILETMTTRRKTLSLIHERQTLIESVEFFAPPAVVNLMVIMSKKILLKDQAMSEHLVDLVFRQKYPLSVIHRVLETTSKIIPATQLLEMVRQRLTDHFNEGYNDITLEGSRGEKISTCFAKQFAKSCRMGLRYVEGTASPACQEWWDKLRYLIARSSNRPNNGKNDTILHTALTNPRSQPSMIEYLCRLNPSARYEPDIVTGEFPIHFACMHWHPEKYGLGNESSRKRDLNLLLAGDFGLVRSRGCHGRIALHYAILNGKSMSYIQSLLNLDRETISIHDPVTKLVPFQLAAMSEKYDGDKLASKTSSPRSLRCDSTTTTQQIDVIYNLLRTNPFAVSRSCGNIGPETEMTPLTRHALKWCYDNVSRGTSSKWKLNSKRKDLIRHAIENCYIPTAMKKWWSSLKELILEVYIARKEPGWNPTSKSTRSVDYFLHAALWSSTHIPSIAIELILKLFPPIVHGKEPGTDLFPLHIAAQVPTYTLLPFEKTLSMGSTLEMVTVLDSCALRMKTKKGKLPLHMAIESGKRWKDLRTMINMTPQTLSIRDPSTGLFPFQLVACGSSIIPNHRNICAKMAYTKSKNVGTEENARILRSLCKEYELEKLTSIFSMLRAKPSVIGKR